MARCSVKACERSSPHRVAWFHGLGPDPIGLCTEHREEMRARERQRRLSQPRVEEPTGFTKQVAFTSPEPVAPPARSWDDEEWALIRHGFRATQMEMKWNFWTDDRDVLHICRSWTGLEVYRARFEEAWGEHRIVQLERNGAPENAPYRPLDGMSEPEFVAWLIDEWLVPDGSWIVAT